MKHLFVVHSNITYLAALGVICKENLPLEDVIIVSDMYERREPVLCHYIAIQKPISHCIYTPTAVLRPFKYVDKIVDSLTQGQPFTLYVALFSKLQRIIVSNDNCIGFHFIEEGLSNYCAKAPLRISLAFIDEHRAFRNKTIKNFISDLLLLIKGYNSKIQSFPFLYDGYANIENVKFYGFDDETFTGIKNVDVISLQEIISRFQFQSNYHFDNEHLWIGSSAVVTKYQTIENYLNAIKIGVVENLVKQRVTKVYLKFHPMECQFSKDGTINLFLKHNIEVEIIPDNVVLEIELMDSKDTTLWGVDSSLMYYVAKMGVKCNSIVNYLIDYPFSDTPSYWKIINKG